MIKGVIKFPILNYSLPASGLDFFVEIVHRFIFFYKCFNNLLCKKLISCWFDSMKTKKKEGMYIGIREYNAGNLIKECEPVYLLNDSRIATYFVQYYASCK